MLISFDELPDSSRLWIFQSDRLITEQEQEQVSAQLTKFVNNWASHGADIKASFDIRHDCFVIVAADESQQVASGCSIDSLTGVFKSVGNDLSLNFFDRFVIAVYDTSVKVLSMQDFKQAIASHKIDSDTMVFNNMIHQKGDLSKLWMKPIRESWHKRYL